jgi:preprotein translocase subunit YajC
MNLIPQAMAQTEQAPPTAESPAPATPPTPATPAVPAPAPGPAAPPSNAATSTQAPPPAGGGATDALTDQFQIMAPFLVIVAIVYFIVLRPQQRAQKEAQAALKNVRRGDVIATSGGLIGKVTKAVDDNEVEIEIAPNVRTRLLRSAIAEVRAKSEPVKDAPGAKS